MRTKTTTCHKPRQWLHQEAAESAGRVPGVRPDEWCGLRHGW